MNYQTTNVYVCVWILQIGKDFFIAQLFALPNSHVTSHKSFSFISLRKRFLNQFGVCCSHPHGHNTSFLTYKAFYWWKTWDQPWTKNQCHPKNVLIKKIWLVSAEVSEGTKRKENEIFKKRKFKLEWSSPSLRRFFWRPTLKKNETEINAQVKAHSMSKQLCIFAKIVP